MLIKVVLTKSMVSHIPKFVLDVIVSLLEHLLNYLQKTSFFTCTSKHTVCINPDKFFMVHFFKAGVSWCTSDFGDQNVSHKPIFQKISLFSIFRLLWRPKMCHSIATVLSPLLGVSPPNSIPDIVFNSVICWFWIIYIHFSPL